MVQYQGSFTGLAKQMVAAVLPVAAAICLLLFGELGARLFLASLLVIPMILALAWLVSRLDRAELDDGEGVIRRNWRKAIPYADVKVVRFIRSMGAVQVTATLESKRSEVLLFGLRLLDADTLEEGLERRCPNVTFERRAYASWKLTALAVGLLAAVGVAGHFYLARKSPASLVSCAVAPPAPSADSGEPLVREGEGIVVTLPREFEHAQFTVARLFSFEETGRTGKAFLVIAGLNSEWSLFRYAACSRFGFVPLVLKAVLLSRWEDPRVLTLKTGGADLLLVTGQREGVSEGRVLVHREDGGLEALVAIRLNEKLGADELARLLGQITIAPGSKL